MRIAVNTRFLIKDQLEGIGVFTHEVFSRLVNNFPEHQFIFCFDRAFDSSFVYGKNVVPLNVFPPARHPFLFYWWFHLALPKVFSKYQPDVFFSPDGFSTLSSSVPTIPVMHDLAFMHYPKDITWLQNAYYRYFFPKYAQSAKRIITVSEYSKNDIAHSFNINPELIDVVGNGAKTVFKPIDKQLIESTRAKLSQGKPYFVYVGAMHQRKNILNLLKAFELYKSQGGANKLVLVGRKAWGTQAMENYYEAMSYKNQVIFTGRLNDEALHSVLASAACLTYLSYFEGFGIPILEAMKCGIPVITANLTSMPEVAGNAALLVNPFAVDDIAQGMHKIEKDKNLVDDLIKAAQTQQEQYSWDKTAEKVWKSISIAIQNDK